MLDKNAIRYIREVVAPQQAPILSLYLDVNPAKPENAGGAPLIRVKDALKELNLPKPYVAELLRRLELDHGVPQGRTLVVFAGEDLDKLFVRHLLQLELPAVGSRGILARWGKPLVTPLLQAVDEQERFGVVLVDEARMRYFEVFFGEIDERQDVFLPLDTSEWRELTEARTGTPVGVPARGGSGRDQFERRKEAWVHRFYRQAAELLEQAVAQSDVGRLLVLGNGKHAEAFAATLPNSLRERVAVVAPGPSHFGASASEVLRIVEPLIEERIDAQQRALVDELAERGVHGVEAVLEDLQEGRLQLVAAPWSFDRTVYRCAESDYVAGSLGAVEKYCPDQHHRLELLQELLPELVAEYGAKLTYLRGEAAERLTEAMGGLAGLPRW